MIPRNPLLSILASLFQSGEAQPPVEYTQEPVVIEAANTLVLSAEEPRTYIVDLETFSVLHEFEGALRDYFPETDTVLTETAETVFAANWQYTVEQPEGVRPMRNRSTFTRNNLHIWNGADGKKISTITGIDLLPQALEHMPVKIVKGRVLAWDAFTWNLSVIDIASGSVVAKLPAYVQGIHEDENLVFGNLQYSGGIVRIDTEKAEIMFAVLGELLHWSVKNNLCLTLAGNEYLISDLDTGNNINTFPGGAGRGGSVNPAGTKFLAYEPGTKTLGVWEIGSGRKICEIPFDRHVDYNYSVYYNKEFDKNGGKVAIGNTATLEMWDIGEGVMLWSEEFEGHGWKFSEDDKVFMATGYNGKPRYWDAQTGERVAAAEAKDLFNIEQKDMTTHNTRSGDIVWETHGNSIVFRNASDGGEGGAFLKIKLPKKMFPASRLFDVDDAYGAGTREPVHFSADGKRVIVSVKTRD